MPRWLARALRRIHASAGRRDFQLTAKARREAGSIHLGREDIGRLLASLSTTDWSSRFASSESDEWMYVFIVSLEGLPLYVKVVLRGAECVVVSFHEDQNEDSSRETEESSGG